MMIKKRTLCNVLESVFFGLLGEDDYSLIKLIPLRQIGDPCPGVKPDPSITAKTTPFARFASLA